MYKFPPPPAAPRALYPPAHLAARLLCAARVLRPCLRTSLKSSYVTLCHCQRKAKVGRAASSG